MAIAYASSQAVDGLVGEVWVNNKLIETSLGASYDFGPVKVFAEIMQMQFAMGAGTKTDNKYNGGLLGVTVPLGPGLIRASYARVKFNNDTQVAAQLLGSTNTDASSQKLALGYVHNLSKRTALYATVAKVQIKDGQNNPDVMGVTTGAGLTYLSTGAGVRGHAPRSSTGYDFGVRHSF